MKKIDWIAISHVSADGRFKVTRIHDDREDVTLFDRREAVNVFSSVGPAMRHAEHLAEKGEKR